MKLILIIFLFFTCPSYSQLNCKFSENYIPEDLENALVFLNCKWTEEDKDSFKIQEETKTVSNLHFETGLSIRNSWGLWNRKSALVQYFNSINIFHPDDMSTIILTSFHRELNKKDIDLEGQVKFYTEYRSRVRKARKEKEKEQKKLVEIEFRNYKIGDSVKIAYKINPNQKYVFIYGIQKYAGPNEIPDCFVKGVVKSKKVKKNKYYLLKILITDICGYKEAIDSNGVLITGQEYEFNIDSYKVISTKK